MTPLGRITPYQMRVARLLREDPQKFAEIASFLSMMRAAGTE